MSTLNSPDITQNNQTYVQQKDKEQPVQAKPAATVQANTIWAKMTQAEAVKNNVLDLFKEYDKNENKVIDNDEFENYSEEDETNNYINQLFQQPSISLNEYVKTKFNIDNFDNMTPEEKEKVLAEVMNKKYEANTNNKDSNYNTEINRLKNGNYNKFEQKRHKLTKDSKLSDEQLAQYAQKSNHFDEIKELSNLLVNVKSGDDKKLLFSTLGKLNGDMKNSMEDFLTKMLRKLNDKDKEAFIKNAEKAGVKINLSEHEQPKKNKIEKKYLDDFATKNGFTYDGLAHEGPIDFDKYAKDNYNLDLSNMTDEEKSKKIGQAIDNEFKVGSKKYKENFVRLKYAYKTGNYTKAEKEILKLGNKRLSNKEVEKYAKAALDRQKAYEEAKLLVNITDEKSKKIFYNSLAHQDNKTQGRLLAFIVSTIEDSTKQKEFLKDLTKAGIAPDMRGMTTNDAYQMGLITSNVDTKASIDIMSNATGSKEQINAATQGAIDANKEQLENGGQSEEEYNEKNHYAAEKAHEFKSYASEVYKVLEANTTDSNRADIMKTLASHVYQIQDENERGQALNGLTSSKYYNEDVAKSINESYKISTTPDATKGETKSDATTPQPVASNNVNNTDNVSQQTRNVTELKEQARQYETENRTTNPISNINEEHETKEVSNSIKSADENGITQKEKAIRGKKVSELLDYCFRNGTPSKKVEQIIFNKLSAASVPLIYNVFINCNAKVKKYIFDTKLMTPATLSNYLRSDDMKKIPDEIKSAVEKYKEDNNLDQKRYATV